MTSCIDPRGWDAKDVVTLVHNTGLEPSACQEALQKSSGDYAAALTLLTADHPDSVWSQTYHNDLMGAWDEISGGSHLRSQMNDCGAEYSNEMGQPRHLLSLWERARSCISTANAAVEEHAYHLHDAICNYKEMLELSDSNPVQIKGGSEEVMIRASIGLGLCYNRLGNYDEVISNQDLLSRCQAHGEPELTAAVLCVRGTALLPESGSSCIGAVRREHQIRKSIDWHL
jgi:hypothetical protein